MPNIITAGGEFEVDKSYQAEFDCSTTRTLDLKQLGEEIKGFEHKIIAKWYRRKAVAERRIEYVRTWFFTCVFSPKN